MSKGKFWKDGRKASKCAIKKVSKIEQGPNFKIKPIKNFDLSADDDYTEEEQKYLKLV